MKSFAWLKPAAFLLILLAIWQAEVALHPHQLMPGPWKTAQGIVSLFPHGLILKYTVASVFRVTWGFLLAVLVAVPLGLAIGWSPRAELALNPILQILRPISPLAWIPIAILWFGVGDLAAVFLIFIGCFLPLLLTVIDATRSVPAVYINAGRNFGLGPIALMRRILYPAIVPRLMTGLRITLGIAWLVVVAAEMIAVNSGLGFLIVDARNAGNRYDLVVAGMVIIGVVGLLLDSAVRMLERSSALRWGFEEKS